jgi:hypothetical protein
MSKRENQLFEGRIRDKDLYIIEDALNGVKIKKEIARQIILKLYMNFWETKDGKGIPMARMRKGSEGNG